VKYQCLTRYRQFTTSEAPTTMERLSKLIDYYANKPIGIFHKIYISRIFGKDLFDNGMDSDNEREFMRNVVKLRSYICSQDGLTKLERGSIITDSTCWCPSIPKDELNEMCDIGGSLSDDQLKAVCDSINEEYTIQHRTAILLMALCGAAMDELHILKETKSLTAAYKYGVTEPNLQAFQQIAKLLGMDETTTKDIYVLYTEELRLMQKYEELLMHDQN